MLKVLICFVLYLYRDSIKQFFNSLSLSFQIRVCTCNRVRIEHWTTNQVNNNDHHYSVSRLMCIYVSMTLNCRPASFYKMKAKITIFRRRWSFALSLDINDICNCQSLSIHKHTINALLPIVIAFKWSSRTESINESKKKNPAIESWTILIAAKSASSPFSTQFFVYLFICLQHPYVRQSDFVLVCIVFRWMPNGPTEIYFINRWFLLSIF